MKELISRYWIYKCTIYKKSIIRDAVEIYILHNDLELKVRVAGFHGLLRARSSFHQEMEFAHLS